MSTLKVDLEKHSQALLRFALSLCGNDACAEELVQETLLRAVKQCHPSTEILDERAWLFTITVNLWRDQCRQQKRRPVIEPLHLLPNADLPACQEPSSVETREHLSQVLTFFQELPERQREVLYLRTVEGQSVAAIAKLLGTSENNVSSNLSIARKRLRQRFQSTLSGTRVAHE